MKKEKEYKVPRKKKPFFFLIRWIVKLIFRKPKIINVYNEVLEDKEILVANHASKTGPVTYKLYFPKYECNWGIYHMLGDLKTRFHYMRDIFYMQKKGYNKFFASIRGGFEAFFSYEFYKAMGIIASYPDARLKTTINQSMTLLDNDYNVLIFPEDSSTGYHDELTRFYPGFVILSEKYYNKYGIDLPIVPLYYNKKKRCIYIGKKEYIQDYIKQGLSRDEIAEIFRQKVNDLYLKSK